MTRKTRKGTSPAAAIGLLVVCAGIAFWSLRGQFGAGPAVADGDQTLFADDPLADEAGLDAQSEMPGTDLLLRHGSWSAQVPVHMAFANVVDAVAAAPLGETGASTVRRWIGADPPTMRLGVLMIGETVRRAVVDGRVVGLGDTVGKALIVAIERDTVTATWGGKRLTYDLDGDQPREFRAELARRGVERRVTPAAGVAEPIQESRQ